MSLRSALPSTVVVVSLATLLSPLPVRAGRIVIITNADTGAYHAAEQSLAKELKSGNSVSSFALEGLGMAAAKRLAYRIAGMHPTVLLALGDKAAYLAAHFIKSVPVVFGETANWQSLGLQRSRTAGIKNTLDAETMCSNIKMFLPGMRRIGVIYTKVSKHYVERAMRRAAVIGMTLLPIFVQSAGDFSRSYKSLAGQVDLFWLVQDPVLITKDNLRDLLEQSKKAHLPTVTYSETLVQMGMLMSIVPDPVAVAQQMAEAAKRIIAGTPAADLPIAAPAKATVTFNKDRMEALGLKVDPMLLDLVSVVRTAK